MKQKNIIDDLSEPRKNSPFKDCLKWWESKRWFYNVILILLAIFILFIVYGFDISRKEFIRCSLWGVGANVFFSCGALIDASLTSFLEQDSNSHTFRRILLILMTIASIFITLFATYIFL